jgi:hypothetical protein
MRLQLVEAVLKSFSDLLGLIDQDLLAALFDRSFPGCNRGSHRR